MPVIKTSITEVKSSGRCYQRAQRVCIQKKLPAGSQVIYKKLTSGNGFERMKG